MTPCSRALKIRFFKNSVLIMFLFCSCFMLNCSPKMSSIDKWLIFSILEPEFTSNIKIACVFGSSGNEALIVNKDDDVYALGSNCSGCLGSGDSHGSLEPRKGNNVFLIVI